MIEFTLSGTRFRGKHLSPERSLEAFALLSPVLSEVLDSVDPKGATSEDEGERSEAIAKALGAALRQFTKLPQLAPFFYERYEVSPPSHSGFAPLPVLKDEVFGGRAALHVAFVIAAIRHEFADFLSSNGFNTLADLAKACGFQITLGAPGPSGD